VGKKKSSGIKRRKEGKIILGSLNEYELGEELVRKDNQLPVGLKKGGKGKGCRCLRSQKQKGKKKREGGERHEKQFPECSTCYSFASSWTKVKVGLGNFQGQSEGKSELGRKGGGTTRRRHLLRAFRKPG